MFMNIPIFYFLNLGIAAFFKIQDSRIYNDLIYEHLIKKIV